MHVLHAEAHDTVLAGARAALPVALLVAIFGAYFGMLAPTAGISPLAALAMSATTFAGSAQFAVISVLADGGSLAAAVAAAVLLNARYGPIGASVAPALRGGPLRRLALAQLVVDESWALATGPRGHVAAARLAGAGLTLYIGWLLGTALGLAIGRSLADPAAFGLDAAFPALFLGLLAPRLRTGAGRAAAIAGLAIALTLVPFTPAGVPIVAAAAGALIGWRRT